MFYADFVYRTPIHRYIVLGFSNHFDEVVNGSTVRSIPFSAIPWC